MLHGSLSDAHMRKVLHRIGFCRPHNLRWSKEDRSMHRMVEKNEQKKNIKHDECLIIAYCAPYTNRLRLHFIRMQREFYRRLKCTHSEQRIKRIHGVLKSKKQTKESSCRTYAMACDMRRIRCRHGSFGIFPQSDWNSHKNFQYFFFFRILFCACTIKCYFWLVCCHEPFVSFGLLPILGWIVS